MGNTVKKTEYAVKGFKDEGTWYTIKQGFFRREQPKSI